MECAICELTGVYGYRRVNGKNLCVPCLSMCVDAFKAYIADVAHKSQKQFPTIHEHRKIKGPDVPSDKDIHP